MIRPITAILLFAITSVASYGQHTSQSRNKAAEIVPKENPAIHYVLTIDTVDLTHYEIAVHLRNMPQTFRIALAAHPEYDDRFWRFVKNLRVDAKSGAGTVFRDDSALWRVLINGNEAIIRYSIQLPPVAQDKRPAWRPFLFRAGGLVGDIHSFMYVVGDTKAPSTITLKLPTEWRSASSLPYAPDSETFIASSAAVLTDAPILVGHFHSWDFLVDSVPHHVCYLSHMQTLPFDTIKLVHDIRGIVTAAKNLFGRLPYRAYYFLLQDNAYGALEHSNSVTLGAPAEQLADNSGEILSEITHEYFHAWNLVRIRPAEWGDVDYRTPALSKVLWWSEGVTLFYADLLLRRAGLPTQDSSRQMHLAVLLKEYFANPGYVHCSAEKISLAANGPNGMLGDYIASTHLQGELLGSMLDILIRDGTDGKLSMDDIIRKVMTDFGHGKGLTSHDIEREILAVSGYNAHDFFADHVYGKKLIDFNRYLQLIGLKCIISWQPAVDESGKMLPDIRVYVWQESGQKNFKIQVMDASGCWTKSGIHTGEVVTAVNGVQLNSNRDFYTVLRRLNIGDTVSVTVVRSSGLKDIGVVLSGYQQPVIHVSTLPNITGKQRRLLDAWEAGKPR